MTCVSGMAAAHAPWSLFPRTAMTGATASRAWSTSGRPMSPAWIMRSAPTRAATASGRTSPCVSAIIPRKRLVEGSAGCTMPPPPSPSGRGERKVPQHQRDSLLKLKRLDPDPGRAWGMPHVWPYTVRHRRDIPLRCPGGTCRHLRMLELIQGQVRGRSRHGTIASAANHAWHLFIVGHVNGVIPGVELIFYL